MSSVCCLLLIFFALCHIPTKSNTSLKTDTNCLRRLFLDKPGQAWYFHENSKPWQCRYHQTGRKRDNTVAKNAPSPPKRNESHRVLELYKGRENASSEAGKKEKGKKTCRFIKGVLIREAASTWQQRSAASCNRSRSETAMTRNCNHAILPLLLSASWKPWTLILISPARRKGTIFFNKFSFMHKVALGALDFRT